MINRRSLLQPCIEVARKAGQAILEVSYSRQLAVQKKEDKTPVTLADLRANDIICEALTRLTPDIPILSEEMSHPSFSQRSTFSECWMIDPLDGTRGFVAGSHEYTVNIALIEQHQPILGVIYAPFSHQLYYACKTEGAFLCKHDTVQSLRVSAFNHDRPLVIAVSQYHNSAWLNQMLQAAPPYQLLRLNSSIKMGVIAEGAADFYPRLGPTSEWDTAAGQIVLEEAGGVLIDLEGNPLRYNARDTLINPGFIAVGDAAQKAYFLELMSQFREYSNHSRIGEGHE